MLYLSVSFSPDSSFKLQVLDNNEPLQYNHVVSLLIPPAFQAELTVYIGPSLIMPNKWNKVKAFVLRGGYKKLIRPTVSLHGTAFPKSSSELEKLGVRFDFAGTVEEDGKRFHRFQVQVNAGNKIPTSWKQWREKHEKGTHGIVATIKVPDGGTKEDVEAALAAVDDEIE